MNSVNKLFSLDKLISSIEHLASYSETPANEGVTRFAYSKHDESAHHYIIDLAQQYGLLCKQDAVGNVLITLQGQEQNLPAVATGSHLDTVPNGGKYDGIIGVMAGLYALTQYKPKQLKRNVQLIIFRSEESSRFGISCIGSKIMTGNADLVKWSTTTDNSHKTVLQAIDDAGYQSHNIPKCKLNANHYAAFIELHIEQGKCLESAQKQIGIVNGIAAPTRFQVDVYGQADHSGATPMNQRQDALVIAASLITTMNRLANNEAYLGTVGTVGKLNVYPNAMNVIPGHVQFFVDIRGVDEHSIDRVAKGLQIAIAELQQKTQVNIAINPLSQEAPVKLDTTLCDLIKQISIKNGISYLEMLSGAGHDAMYMAQLCRTAMIFIPSKGGISHHKDEYSTDHDIMLGATLLTQTLAKLADNKENY